MVREGGVHDFDFSGRSLLLRSGLAHGCNRESKTDLEDEGEQDSTVPAFLTVRVDNFV